MADEVERSGIALNCGDSGWPVASEVEAAVGPVKDGTGDDPEVGSNEALTAEDGTITTGVPDNSGTPESKTPEPEPPPEE